MRRYFHLLIALFAISFLPSIIASAQDTDGKTVSLVVSGEGTTKDEATKNALRSAIEQAFGTFVSANTDVLNDELVKDEIVTVTSGNVQSYKEISYLDKGDTKEVSLQTVVSIGKLVSYAQNKGMTTELAGATFAMNKKIYQLNKENEKKAMDHLMTQLTELADKGLFDYQIEVGDPVVASAPRNPYDRDVPDMSKYNQIEIIVKAVPNAQADLFRELVYNTVSSLKLPKEELEEVKSKNMEFHSLLFLQVNSNKKYASFGLDIETINLRNNYIDYIKDIRNLVNESSANFVLSDNLKNCFRFNCIFNEQLCIGERGAYDVFSESKNSNESNPIHFAFASDSHSHGRSNGHEMINISNFSDPKYYHSPATLSVVAEDEGKARYMPIACTFVELNQTIDLDSDQTSRLYDMMLLPGISSSNYRFIAFYSDTEMDSLSKIIVTASPNGISDLITYDSAVDKFRNKFEIIAVSNFKE